MFKEIIKFGFWIINITTMLWLGVQVAFASVPLGTVAPTIPEISTLPGPKGTNVSEANQYLKEQFLPNIAMTVIKIAIPLAVVFLIFGAIQFLTSFGSDDKLSLAKKTLAFALAGLIISLLSYAIVQLIFFTGFKITQ